jgi:hypothetical protein
MDFPHVPVVYAGDLPIVPSDRDRVPTPLGDNPAVARIASPINAIAHFEALGFGDCHRLLLLLLVVAVNVGLYDLLTIGGASCETWNLWRLQVEVHQYHIGDTVEYVFDIFTRYAAPGNYKVRELFRHAKASFTNRIKSPLENHERVMMECMLRKS